MSMQIFSELQLVDLITIVISIHCIVMGRQWIMETKRWIKYGRPTNVRRFLNTPSTAFLKTYGWYWCGPSVGLIIVMSCPSHLLLQGMLSLSSVYALIARFAWTGMYVNNR
jgi:hypothetical protein